MKQLKKTTIHKHGFTLIELLIVISIIGVLSSIVFVTYKGVKEKARIATSMEFSHQIHSVLGADAKGIWDFEQIDGGKTYDISGYNNHGTVHGAIFNPTGGVNGGGAFEFNGTTDYIVGTSNLGISGNAEFTMAAWIYWDGASWSSSWPSFMGMASEGNANRGLSFTMNSGRPAVDFWNCRVRADNALSVKTWYYIVGTKTPGTKAATTKIYVNGVQVDASIEGIDSVPDITDATFYIGRLGSNSTYYFNGSIDNVHIYGAALDSAQIESNYYAGLEKLLAKGLIDKNEYQNRLSIQVAPNKLK